MNAKANRFSPVLMSGFLGITALLVSFVAASACETPGTTSPREITAMSIAAGLYLAFCQFWVAPRGTRRFRAQLATLAALIAPLVAAVIAFASWAQGIPWLASGFLGGVIGAIIEQKVTAAPLRGTPLVDANRRSRSCRRHLVAGLIPLIAIALLISIGVIPSVFLFAAPDFNARPTATFLGISVLIDLKAAAILASAIRRPYKRDPSSKRTLGITAFLALLLGLSYLGMAALVHGKGASLWIAFVLLILCAVLGFITTAIMTVASVIVDRARLCAGNCPQMEA